mgnify:CR=1 FL=1
MTDANLFLGRLLPDFFPKIFGKNEDEGLDVSASEKLMKELTEQINKETGKNMSADEVAFGFLTVANETMTRPIRSLTEAKGHDTSKHRLATFGGAGGQVSIPSSYFPMFLKEPNAGAVSIKHEFNVSCASCDTKGCC